MNSRFEEQPVHDTSLRDLSRPLWERFLGSSTDAPELVLEKIGLLTRDSTGTLRASVAGVLLASEEPDRHLPSATITAVSYRGTERNGAYQLDALTIRGPLDEQIRQAMLFLRRNQKVAATKAPHRIETPQFSERAVFEAVVNAVAHRDYSIYGSRIRFFLYADRLELFSPGSLPNTVTVETLSLRQATRNELITRLLSQIRVPESAGDVRRTYFLERRGDGVPIILRESEALSGRRPEYRLFDRSELLLTIFAAKLDHSLLDPKPTA
jgi:predicted HTH transcriptional regulator